jgi:hypothetical protein
VFGEFLVKSLFPSPAHKASLVRFVFLQVVLSLGLGDKLCPVAAHTISSIEHFVQKCGTPLVKHKTLDLLLGFGIEKDTSDGGRTDILS